MDQQILTLLNGDESCYPRALEQQFPRVLKNIVASWDTPNMENYLYELLIDTRNGTRQGFPPEVASDIFNLQKAYRAQHMRMNEIADVWGDIPEQKRIELAELGYTTSLGCFVRAVEAGSEAAVQIFLSSGVDMELRDERYWTPLIITAFHGHEPLSSMLINCGAKIQVQDRNGYTPLHWSSFNGHARVVELLLKHGAEVDAASQFGWTALMQAATRGYFPAVTKLLVHGADVNRVTSDGWTALHKAAANGNDDIVLLLLQKGADRSVAYPDGSTALSLASKNHHDKIVELLKNFKLPASH